MESFIDAKEQDGRLTFIVEIADQIYKEALLHGTEQFLWMTQVEMAKPIMGMGQYFCKNCGWKIVEVLNFQILWKYR